MRRPTVILGLVLGLLAAALVASASASDFTAKTLVQTKLTGDPNLDFSPLATAPGEPYFVRTDLAGAQAGRDTRRTSLSYFGQLSDFQLSDEESPARVEFFDGQGTNQFSNSGHRPQEALLPQEIEESIREMDEFAAASPVANGDGSHSPMDEALLTGDLADSNTSIEADWVKTLLEGGATLDPNSGQDPTTSDDPFCVALGTLLPGLFENPAKYTGVQDYGDYVEGHPSLFYDPNQPQVGSQFANWPQYTGLMDKAQEPFNATGLSVPSYITPGNHDVLVQGNLSANAAFERVSTGCVKPIGPFPGGFDPASIQAILDPAFLQSLVGGNAVAIVPPDNRRSYLSKEQYRQTFAGQASSNGHGFGYIDPDELAASNGSALYYSFGPQPGIRFVSLDTNSSTAAALVDPTTQSDASNGNLDDPQFQWLKAQLDDAQSRGQIVITYSHHASSSMTFSLPDEGSPPCTINDAHGHDVNPGCDKDPRDSQPIHLGDDFVDLLCQYPNVIAHVAGHSHENRVDPHPCANHDGFWEIKSPAIADWPTESRLLQVMDNHDGTLSIFGTMLNHEGDAAAPSPSDPVSGYSTEQLASLARTIAFNDNQAGGASAANGRDNGDGTSPDRNVELLLDDPRDNVSSGGGADSGGAGGPGSVFNASSTGACATTKRGTRRSDRLRGTAGGDSLIGKRGNDRIKGLAGDDCVKAGRGRDRISGGPGADVLKGGAGSDKIKARDGEVDRIRCGAGRDRVKADAIDVVRGHCERVKRS